MKIDDLAKNPRAWKELAATTKEREAQLAAFKERELRVAGQQLAIDAWHYLQAIDLSPTVEFILGFYEPNRIELHTSGGGIMRRRELSVLFGGAIIKYAPIDLHAVGEQCMETLCGSMLTKLKRSQFDIESRDLDSGYITIKVLFA